MFCYKACRAPPRTAIPGGMKLYLGIDGGGTHTRAILVDARGRVRGEGESGPANYHNVGLDRAAASLRAAAGGAWAAAGQKAGVPARVFIGCAGIKSATDAARLARAAENAGLAEAGTITVGNDLHNALAGGLGGRPGIALIAGTGTHCLGRDAGGRTAFCGGWGWLLDDEGGGMGLALAGLRHAVRVADGRAPESDLLPAALAFLGLSEAEDILARLHTEPGMPGNVADFAPVVTRLAAEGDAAALAVLKQGAAALAGLVAGCARKLVWKGACDVVILGGSARSGPPYQPLIEAAITQVVPRARLVAPSGTSLHGAAFNVLRLAGHEVPPPLLFPSSVKAKRASR